MADGPAKSAKAVDDWQNVQPTDWQDVNAGSTPPPAHTQTNWESNTEPIDTGHAFSDFAHNAGGRAAQSFAQPVTDPKGFGKGLLKIMAAGPGGQWQNAADMAQGYAQSKHPFADIVGDTVAGALQGHLIGGAAQIPKAFSPYESPMLPAGTRAYQNLATKLGPEWGTKAIPNVAENLQAEHPSIMKFGEESGNPIKTPEEYGIAAKGLREKVTNRLYNDMQKPFENERLQVPPEVANFQVPGRIQPIGAYPTVSELNDALNVANEQAGPGYQQGANAFDRAQVMGAKHVASQIGDLLNNHLSSRLEMTPEEVGGFRQRGGALKNLAENAEARSWSNRMTGKAMMPGGEVIDRPLHSIALRGLQHLVGGPEGVANWQFRRALANVPTGEATPLPDVKPRGGPNPFQATPAWFSPQSEVAGPERMAPPPVKMGPSAPNFAPPPVKFPTGEGEVAAPPVRYGPAKSRPSPPPVRFPRREP